MPLLIEDAELARRIIRRRRRLGIDRNDEVWDGDYVVSPNPNNEHQDLISDLATVLNLLVRRPGLGRVPVGPNISDRRKGWKKNYRCPDVAVFLAANPAVDKRTHWLGGPDLAIEVVSPGDRSRQKLDFYAAVGTRELLIVDRNPWAVELYRLERGSMVPAGRSTVESPEVVASEVIPASFRLVEGPERPGIVVIDREHRREDLI